MQQFEGINVKYFESLTDRQLEEVARVIGKILEDRSEQLLQQIVGADLNGSDKQMSGM